MGEAEGEGVYGRDMRVVEKLKVMERKETGVSKKEREREREMEWDLDRKGKRKGEGGKEGQGEKEQSGRQRERCKGGGRWSGRE